MEFISNPESRRPKNIIIIPARMASERLHGKPMLVAGGKPLVHWTYDRAKRTKADHVIVTSSDRDVAYYCCENGLTFWPSGSAPPTGTHRCAEVLEYLQRGPSKIGCVVNWQCDEPLVDPRDVDRLMKAAADRTGLMVEVATLVTNPHGTIEDELADARYIDANVIKAVVGRGGRAFWFSRAPMLGSCLHCGVYAFTPDILAHVGKMQVTPLSRIESLEQLTWIENGVEIQTVRTGSLPLSINAEADWETFKGIVEGRDNG